MVNRCGLRSECMWMMQFSVRSSLVVILRYSPRDLLNRLIPYMVTFVKENGDSHMCGGEYSE